MALKKDLDGVGAGQLLDVFFHGGGGADALARLGVDHHARVVGMVDDDDIGDRVAVFFQFLLQLFVETLIDLVVVDGDDDLAGFFLSSLLRATPYALRPTRNALRIQLLFFHRGGV